MKYTRLNRLASVFPVLVEHLFNKYGQEENNHTIISLTDSMQIITCSGKRKGNVVRELSDNRYNSIKSMYSFGVKLHGIGFYHKNGLPIMEYLKVNYFSLQRIKPNALI